MSKSLRFTWNTADLFGDNSTDQARRDRLEMQERVKATKGGSADTSGLPLFGQNQLDLFVNGGEYCQAIRDGEDFLATINQEG
jgi:hypothetical protein